MSSHVVITQEIKLPVGCILYRALICKPTVTAYIIILDLSVKSLAQAMSCMSTAALCSYLRQHNNSLEDQDLTFIV